MELLSPLGSLQATLTGFTIFPHLKLDDRNNSSSSGGGGGGGEPHVTLSSGGGGGSTADVSDLTLEELDAIIGPPSKRR